MTRKNVNGVPPVLRHAVHELMTERDSAIVSAENYPRHLAAGPRLQIKNV